ncbi:MAG: Tetrapyrrole methylase family protein [uncultured Paraburkholderia sp.]|nr:MAG: Tetrapyrrole methylase family protein [uncultured Paraburkholderia sp.]
MSGTLYLIPNTLGEGDADALGAVLPAPRFAPAPRRFSTTSAKMRKLRALF